MVMPDLIPDEELRMDAYYYGFHRTGVIEIDRILSAVARAGKAFHLTEDWNEPAYGGDTSPVDWIQGAANDAAAGFRRVSPVTREALADAIEAAGTDWNYRLSENLPTRPLADEVADAVFDLLSVSPPAEVTDDMVERGARAMYEDAHPDKEWANVGPFQSLYRAHVRAALSAALGGGE